MAVMGLNKLGGVSPIQFYFGFFLTLQRPLMTFHKKPVTGVTGQGGLFLLVGVPSQRLPVEGLLAPYHGLQQFCYLHAISQVEGIYANHLRTSCVDKNGSCVMWLAVPSILLFLLQRCKCVLLSAVLYTGMQSLMSKHSVFEVYLHLP